MSTMKTIHANLSKNLRRLLEKNNLSMEALSFEIDVNKGHLSRVISLKRKASLDLVQKIADYFEVKVERLFKE